MKKSSENVALLQTILPSSKTWTEDTYFCNVLKQMPQESLKPMVREAKREPVMEHRVTNTSHAIKLC